MVFEKAIQKTAPADEVKQRVINLTDEITYSVYMYTARGLFERDKLIFLAQLAFQVTSGLDAPCVVLGPAAPEPRGVSWGAGGEWGWGACWKCKFSGSGSDPVDPNLHF